MIKQLLTEKDNFEIVRDKIAQILANESANQVSLATSENLDPKTYELQVFSERSNPWQLFDDEDVSNSPIVNVWFDNSKADLSKSVLNQYQHFISIFNIDVIGTSASIGTNDGHLPGDELAALNSHRGARLCRQILMADSYTYLELDRRYFGQRYVSDFKTFQASNDAGSAERAVGTRIVLAVPMLEFSPQYQPENLEGIDSKVVRKENGQILAALSINYPTI